jgi:hypothetical protein
MAGFDARIVASDEISVSCRKSRLLTFVGKDILKGMLAFGEAIVGLLRLWSRTP